MDNPLNELKKSNKFLLFIIIPTIFLIVGYFVYPYPNILPIADVLIQIPMFLGPIILAIGFMIKNDLGKKVKITGWTIFAFYWSTQPAVLYISEGGDLFNSGVCVIGVYILMYFAYNEWLSLLRKENISCLNWIAGASAISGLIYFGIERTVLAKWLIDVVALQSTIVLNTFIGNAEVQGPHIFLDGNYVVNIIFACTAVQAMVIFVGMIGALKNVDVKRRIIGIAITIIPVYILNLLRNALVVFLIGKEITDFNMAHNIIAKSGALITLIVLLFVLTKLIPEIVDELICLTNLPKRIKH